MQAASSSPSATATSIKAVNVTGTGQLVATIDVGAAGGSVVLGVVGGAAGLAESVPLTKTGVSLSLVVALLP